jgi:HK97 family phage major capsid protein
MAQLAGCKCTPWLVLARQPPRKVFVVSDNYLDDTIDERIIHFFGPQLERIKGIADKLEAKAVLDSAQEWRQTAASLRTPSKAHLIGGGRSTFDYPEDRPGAFISAVATAGDSREFPEARTAAKATLEVLTAYQDGWGDAARVTYGGEAWSKATLATTDATGGWIVPNALVDEIIKPALLDNPYRSLVTVVPGVTAFQIDVPMRTARPSRMTIVSRGATKENVDLTYNGYTATMYTLARVHDLANQFLKQSAGAAERDVISELGQAAALGERYYIMEGSGSSEPYGLQTAITNSAYSDEITHTPATTLAGSVAAAVAKGLEVLLGRGVFPDAAVVSGATFGLALSQGADQAGFYVPDAFSANRPWENPIRVRGIPLIPDPSMTASDDLIVGRFKSLKVYFGDSFRIDSSSVAGNRWDENETGFRGEFEMGLDARAAVFTGNFTHSADVTP